MIVRDARLDPAVPTQIDDLSMVRCAAAAAQPLGLRVKPVGRD